MRQLAHDRSCSSKQKMPSHVLNERMNGAEQQILDLPKLRRQMHRCVLSWLFELAEALRFPLERP